MKLSTPMSWTPFALCIALALAALPTHATILGALGNSTYRIDETTATDVLLSNNAATFLAQITAMAKNSAGVIYATGGENAGMTGIHPVLSTIDPVTGVITIGPDINGFGPIHGLAFNSADVLYAVRAQTGGGGQHSLITINTTTGIATFIANVSGSIRALEFGPNGLLYGWDAGGLGLVTINPATGAVTDVNPAIGGGFEVATLAFSPGGVLYGANSNLYTIDIATGALTLVGAFNPVISVFGMEFVGAGPGAPAVSLTPSSLAFGNQQLATTSAAQPLTLQNIGTAVLNIASITASGDFAQTNTCGATLAASASCTINVTFTPTVLGARSGSVSVVSNAAGSPHSSSLSGTGIAAGPPPPAPSTPIPTLNEWALLMLMVALIILGMTRLRRSR